MDGRMNSITEVVGGAGTLETTVSRARRALPRSRSREEFKANLRELQQAYEQSSPGDPSWERWLLPSGPISESTLALWLHMLGRRELEIPSVTEEQMAIPNVDTDVPGLFAVPRQIPQMPQPMPLGRDRKLYGVEI